MTCTSMQPHVGQPPAPCWPGAPRLVSSVHTSRPCTARCRRPRLRVQHSHKRPARLGWQLKVGGGQACGGTAQGSGAETRAGSVHISAVTHVDALLPSPLRPCGCGSALQSCALAVCAHRSALWFSRPVTARDCGSCWPWCADRSKLHALRCRTASSATEVPKTWCREGAAGDCSQRHFAALGLCTCRTLLHRPPISQLHGFVT